ncbi:MAG TPA: flagellar protein FlgN [Firmicutes bacterium]|nr:flagellar protein FlgN [Bacillota bacterium]
MQEDVALLQRLLTEEAARYTSLLGLARRKADLLSSRASVSEVEDVAGQEARVLDELARLERDRMKAMGRLAEAFGLPAPALTVSALCARLPGELAEPLSRLAGALSSTLAELKAVNGLNAGLLRQELALVSFSLDLLTNAPGRATYQNPAGASGAGGTGSAALLDARA